MNTLTLVEEVLALVLEMLMLDLLIYKDTVEKRYYLHVALLGMMLLQVLLQQLLIPIQEVLMEMEVQFI